MEIIYTNGNKSQISNQKRFISAAIRNSNDPAARLKTLHYNDRVPAVFLTTVVYHGRSYLAKRNVTLTVR